MLKTVRVWVVLGSWSRFDFFLRQRIVQICFGHMDVPTCPVCLSLVDIAASREGTASAHTCCRPVLFALSVWSCFLDWHSATLRKTEVLFTSSPAPCTTAVTQALLSAGLCSVWMSVFLVCSSCLLFTIHEPPWLLSHPCHSLCEWQETPLSRWQDQNPGHSCLPAAWL